MSFEESLIRVRRTWTWGEVGLPKSKASQAPVPMHPMLATFVTRWMRQTPYAQPGDWVFPSFKLKGRQPRVANMLVSDHLRPAAVRAGVIAADWDGRFGFHNFRHSLASYLVRSKTDPKTVQALLRHSDVKTTLQLYSHSVSEDRMQAQGSMLQAILGNGTDERGLSSLDEGKLKSLEMWWPGTELNRRRQPFQGCALPPELPGHVSKPAVRGLRGLFASR